MSLLLNINELVMFKAILISVCLGTVYFCRADKMLGEGRWSLISVGKCQEKMEKEVLTIEIEKHKMNRTHDGFNINFTVEQDIDYTYGAFIEVCQYVYGGCKPHQIISDESFPGLLKKYADENKIEVLALANIDPPDFPIYKGEYVVKDFMVDYCKVPRNGIYGKFDVNAYILSNGKKVGCLNLVLQFDELDEDENIC